MKVNVVGFMRADFTTKDGKSIAGYRVFTGRPISSEIGEGMAVDANFVTLEKMFTPCRLGEAEIEYNRFGKVESFSSLEKVK